MKFISWNVNGLRACAGKNFMEFFQNIDADIFCVQETKLQEGQIDLDLPGYYQYWNYAVKKGYSGTAIFTKNEPMSVFYGIKDDEEAKEYLAHPILGARLIEISTALLAHKDKSPIAIMGDVDAEKLRSSMTLFTMISEENSVFDQVLQQFYKGKMCVKTLSILNVK